MKMKKQMKLTVTFFWVSSQRSQISIAAKARATKLFDPKANSRLPCHWRAGCGAIDVTGSSQFCFPAVHNWKRGTWKNVQGIWRAGF